jgi:hypothetical protein
LPGSDAGHILRISAVLTELGLESGAAVLVPGMQVADMQVHKPDDDDDGDTDDDTGLLMVMMLTMTMMMLRSGCPRTVWDWSFGLGALRCERGGRRRDWSGFGGLWRRRMRPH